MSERPKLTWEGYCADCKKFNMENPYKSKSDFNRAYGIEHYKERLTIEPKKNHREAAASLDNFIKIAEGSKLRRAVRISEPLPKKIRREIPLAKKPQVLHRESLAHLSDEEKITRRNAKQREARANWTPQQKEQRRLKVLERIKNMDPISKEERRIKNLAVKKKAREKAKALGRIPKRTAPTDPQKLAEYRKYQREFAQRPDQVAKRKAYREKNKEKVNAYNKQYKIQQKQKQSNNSAASCAEAMSA